MTWKSTTLLVWHQALMAKACLIIILILPVCMLAQAAGSILDQYYSKPLRFDVLGNGVDFKPLVFEYDLSSQKSLMVSNVEFSDKTYFWKLVFDKTGNGWLYGFWPEIFIHQGIIEIIDKSGKVLWKHELTRKRWTDWSEQRIRIANDEMKRAQYAFNGLDARFLQFREPFKICISNQKIESQTRLCTRLYEIAEKQKALQLAPTAQVAVPARVIGQNAQWPLKKSMVVEAASPLQFFAELSTGATYEFFAKPGKLNLVEMTQGEDPQTYRLVAWGPHPNISVRDINMQKETYFERLVGWQQTIGDFREFWEVTRKLNETTLTIPGEGGGAFLQEYVITRLPTEKVRPWVWFRSPHGTYIDGSKIFFRKAKSTQVSSTQNSVEFDKADSEQGVWAFQATKKDELNKSDLLVESEGRIFKAYTELFRGYPREVSARMSAILTQGRPLVMAELSANYWFENIFGWNQYYLSNQRWGLSAKYFQSITNLDFGTFDAGFTSLTIDLKYRFNPGLWGRDETWGAIIGTSNIKYDLFDGQFLGFGFFWARSMPRVFDDWMNAFGPVFRYPKWVDMEFIYYPSSVTPAIKAYNFGQGHGTGNWALNFHGKLMWSKQFFGEAGFGIKQFDFDTTDVPVGYTRLNFNLRSMYGTAGLGWTF